MIRRIRIAMVCCFLAAAGPFAPAHAATQGLTVSDALVAYQKEKTPKPETTEEEEQEDAEPDCD